MRKRHVLFWGWLVAFAMSATSLSDRARAQDGSSTLSVLSWNIEINEFTEAHARLAMDLALGAGPQPQIITVQEAWSEFYYTYLDELQNQTGLTWYGAFQTHCQPGAWDGSSCTQSWDQGIGIFSRFPIVDTSAIFLPYADCWTSARAALRAAVDVGGTTVQVFNTHLQTGGCADDAQLRYASLSDIKQWAANYSAPQMLSGDFNAGPDQIDSSDGIGGAFVDVWNRLVGGEAMTAFSPDPSMQLDYWFVDPSGRALPISIDVVTGTGTFSDHYPLRATVVVY